MSDEWDEIEAPLRERVARVAAWVRERIAEDRTVAAAATPGPWEFEGDDLGDDEIYSIHDGEHGDRVGDTVGLTRGHRDGEQRGNGVHAARQHPARILRQCDALDDALAGLEMLVGRSEHPDTRAFARSLIMSLAGIWADADEIGAIYLGQEPGQHTNNQEQP